MSREDTKKAKEFALPKVQKILNYVHNQDKRFGGNLIGVGSAFQGLKTKQADEFDFNVLINDMGKSDWGQAEKRYYNFNIPIDLNDMDTMPANLKIVPATAPLPPPAKGYVYISLGSYTLLKWMNSPDLQFKNDFIPFLVKKHLKDLIQEAIRKLDLREELRLGRKTHGPALTLRIPCNIGDIKEVSVDFAPTVPAGLPFTKSINWPRYGKQWPSREKIERVKEKGINATAKKPFDWLLSFAACEGELMAEIDKDGGCRKKTLRIVKRLREQYWCKTSYKPKISSYMLKCISEERLDQYFHPDVNLLKVKDAKDREAMEIERLKIVDFLANPSRYLHI